MNPKPDDLESPARRGVVTAFAPYAAAAWARAARSAPAERVGEAVIIPFPRQCPALQPRPAGWHPGGWPDPL